MLARLKPTSIFITETGLRAVYYCRAAAIITLMSKHVVKIDSALRDLIPKFVGNLERDTKVMFDAVYSRDFEVLIQTAHRLRGDAPGYGFIEFGKTCGKIEDHAREGHVQVCEDLIENLKQYLNSLEVVYID